MVPFQAGINGTVYQRADNVVRMTNFTYFRGSIPNGSHQGR